MIKVDFLGPIDMDSMELDVKSLQELADTLKQYDNLSAWLDNSAIALNDVIIMDKETPLKDGDKVSLLPPVCGG